MRRTERIHPSITQALSHHTRLVAAMAIRQGCDFLGSVATEMEVLNAQIGQFFTPYEVARFMAMMSLEDAGFLQVAIHLARVIREYSKSE